MSCSMCEHKTLMYGGSIYPEGAEVCFNVDEIDGEHALTVTAYFVSVPERESGTVYRGWVPIKNCPWCGRELEGGGVDG